MRKKWKQVTAILTAAGMLLGCAGCAGSAQESSAPKAETVKSAETEVSAETAGTETVSAETESAAGQEAKSLYPIVTDGSLTLDYWMPISSAALQVIETYADNTAYQKVQEDTGVKINFIHPTVGKEKEQFNLMITSGELPDIIQYASYYNGGVLQGYNDGVYADLTPYLEEYAPDYLALINSSDELRREVYKDGKVIAFERIKTEDDLISCRVLLRGDWLKEFGMDVPVTLEDYEAYFQAILDNKPGVAPIVFKPVGNASEMRLQFGPFDMLPDWYQVDGKVTHWYNNENLREYLTVMNKWYEAGYISKDFISVNTAERHTMFDSGQVGCYIQSVSNAISRTAELSDFELETAPYPRKTQDQILHNGPSKNAVGTSYSTCISTSCENIEEAVAFLNYGYTEEGINTYNYGKEGYSWEKGADGEPVYTDVMLNNPEGLNDSQLAYVHRIHFAPKYTVPDYKCLPANVKDPETLAFLQKWDGKDQYDSAYDMPPVTLTTEENNERADILAEVSPYVEEMVYKFITGAESLDHFDKYLETLQSMNFDRAVEITQQAYDRYMAQ